MEKAEIRKNQQAWLSDTYEAWVHRYGTPDQVVARIRENPTRGLQPIYQHFGQVSGRRIANLMGSNGVKALALALLGADLTIFDYSPGNARYARELAREAGLDIRFVECDVLQIPAEHLRADFDIAFAELGIVHYFTDLSPFMKTVRELLNLGGRFVLRDFHPVSTKLLTFRGSTAKVRKYKVTGDYFDTSLEERDAPYLKHLPPGHSRKAQKVFWRKWTLGEVVTSVAAAGLTVRLLDEEPNLSSQVFDKGIPKTYTLVADKV